ncbi:MAG: MotA/TolQ/ExbB proton channel family protein [Planctomycetaceae bacterium]
MKQQLSLKRFVLTVLAMSWTLLPTIAPAQPPADVGPAGDVAEAAAAASGPAMPSLWDLAIQGGWFMIPIGIASVVTIAFTLERMYGLRRGRILPRNLIRKMRELMSEPALDPRRLWELTDKYPSPLANVVRAAVLKTGRPHAEVEKAVEDAVERETGEMTRNLRPINVVASISPLLGLLGTVQGMILAFMVTSTTTSTGTAKAQELAHGIYTALVTTFAGLCVAVVSVVLANWLEGRIERLLLQMEALFLDLLPQLERYEGKVRIAESSAEEEGIKVRTTTAAPTSASAPPVPAQRPATKPDSALSRKGRPGPPIRPKDEPPVAESTASALPETDADHAARPVSPGAVRSLRSHFDS